MYNGTFLNQIIIIMSSNTLKHIQTLRKTTATIHSHIHTHTYSHIHLLMHAFQGINTDLNPPKMACSPGSVITCTTLFASVSFSDLSAMLLSFRQADILICTEGMHRERAVETIEICVLFFFDYDYDCGALHVYLFVKLGKLQANTDRKHAGRSDVIVCCIP